MLLTDNGLQFTYNCFQAIYEELGVKLLKPTEYHPQANKKWDI